MGKKYYSEQTKICCYTAQFFMWLVRYMNITLLCLHLYRRISYRNIVMWERETSVCCYVRRRAQFEICSAHSSRQTVNWNNKFEPTWRYRPLSHVPSRCTHYISQLCFASRSNLCNLYSKHAALIVTFAAQFAQFISNIYVFVYPNTAHRVQQ